jgi:hypothetical protein
VAIGHPEPFLHVFPEVNLVESVIVDGIFDHNPVAELSTVILADVPIRLAKRAAPNWPRSYPAITLGRGVFVDPDLTVISHLIGVVTCNTNRLLPNFHQLDCSGLYFMFQ